MLKITFKIDLEGDSEAKLNPACKETLRSYGVMGLDWLRDMRAEIDTAYNELHREQFPRIYEDEQVRDV